MMTRFLALLGHEVRLQFRYGIYIAYSFVVGVYLLALTTIGPYLPNWVPGVIVFTDPAVLGSFFLGALMLLEKAENTRSALAITPVSATEYFWAKALTLTATALIAVSVLSPFIHANINWPLLLIATGLTSIHTIGIGVLIAYRFKTVTGYLMGSAAILTPIIAPGFLALLAPMPQWAILVPAASQLKLILVALDSGSATNTELTWMLVVAMLAAIAGILIALFALKKEFGTK